MLPIHLGDEFKLESFQLSECSDEVDSRGLSSNISEEVMSLVEALISVPLEPTGVTKKEAVQLNCSVDLEITQSEPNTGNLSMEGLPLLDSMLDMAVESHMAHCEAALHQSQLPDHYSDYGWNEFYNMHVVQTSRRCDQGFRG